MNVNDAPASINWRLFSEAQEHYSQRGFAYVEAPWLVSDAAYRATTPTGRRFMSTPMGNVVVSAEQSFIQLMIDCMLPEGKFQTISACFRDEPVLDALHQAYFMKLELIDCSPCCGMHELDAVVEAALLMFRRCLSNASVIQIGDEAFDIVHNGIELGSYGIRRLPFLRPFVYGTGLAEPRLSTAIKLSLL